MIDFKPVPFQAHLGDPRPEKQSSLGAIAPPPTIDPVYTGFTGTASIVETIAVVGILGAGAVLGISSALAKNQTPSGQAMGWVAGAGAALLGLLYLGGKTGLGQYVKLPSLNVVPA